jgi:hypothetical protein
MTTDTWYFMFAAISGIGTIWMISGKTLGKREKIGVGIIFGGFLLQTIWYVSKNNWAAADIVLLVIFILLVPTFYFIGRMLRGK